ncbi:class I SAM-dependent methyltransferase [Altererythrobacter sp. Z27]|uniref:class I SAM-dependent methyltransferase n=1 Tax=Altererythrobacter sp. Z27 TaxID=3461147 RepID=UPI0040439B09
MIDAAQQAAWHSFSKSLPKSAQVLDLATGDGKVMRWLLAARRDLKLTGTDSAEQLPEPPRGTKIRPGIRMESLPFPDGRFHAVTSQFGFEYGDIEIVAGEAARVLRQGGTLAILTHRKDGPILAHNLKQREQLRWALEERDLPAIAKRSLQLRSAGVALIPQQIADAPAEGARTYGPQSVAWNIAEAIKQSLVMGARDHPANVARLIDSIVSKAQNELGRIASLESACETTTDAKRFDSAMASAEFEVIAHEPLFEDGKSQPFADFRSYRRS